MTDQREQESSISERAAIVRTVIDGYNKVNSPLGRVDVQAMGDAYAMLDALKSRAQRNLGLSRARVELARETYLQMLADAGKSPEDDPILAFIEEQASFNNDLQGVFDELGEYEKRMILARRKERAHWREKYPISEELPPNFYDRRQFGRFQRADPLIRETIHGYMQDTGIRFYGLVSQFRKVSFFPGTNRKEMYYVLYLWDPNDGEPSEVPSFLIKTPPTLIMNQEEDLLMKVCMQDMRLC